MQGTAAAVDFQIVGIAQLEESKTNPRQHFAKDALSDLTKSIAEKGVLVPLLVRPRDLDASTDLNQFEILAGARRYRAAKAAGLKQVPVLIRDLDDTQALEVQVIENLQRADVHPLEEAEGYKQLLEKGKYDVESLAAKVGKSVSYVYQRLKLADLVPAAKKAFFEEKITAGHAILLARLQPKDQTEVLKTGEQYGGDFMSVRETQWWIHENIHLELKTAPWDLADANLVPTAGSCTACPKRSGANPQLFPDVKAKDTCTDPACFDNKVQTHLVQVEKDLTRGLNRVVKLSISYDTKKKDGVLSTNDWRLAETNAKCNGLAIGLVVEGGWHRKEYRRGAQLRVCTDKKCKEHWAQEPSNSYSSRYENAAYKAKERKTRALNAARDEALKQIAGKIKRWPMTAALVRFAGRSTFEGQKMTCQAFGVWPKDGKTGGFDFRGKLTEFIRASDDDQQTKILAVLTLIPEYGKWSDGYNASQEIPALRTAGKSVGVNVESLERKYVAEAAAKAKKKAKPAKTPKVKAAKKTPKAKTA